MARSAAAVVLGYKSFDPDLDLCGVILNRVGSERHFLLLKDAIQSATGVPVLGRVAFSPEMELPERHLGLLPVPEKNNLAGLLDLMAHNIAGALDLEMLAGIARTAPALRPPEARVFPEEPAGPEVNLGLVLDQAFNFYYQDALDLLAALGARIVPCSSLEGGLPPGLDGLYIGGGFPEMFAGAISGNREFLEGVRRESGRGMPVYAECGGMMFLSRGITDFNGRYYPMAGIIPGETVMLKKRAGLGYVTALALKDNLLAAAGRRIRGHEFHYSVLQGLDQADHAYLLEREGGESRPDGYYSGNLLASYLHIHFAGCPGEARGFIRACREYRQKRLSHK
jgi:cobyrinic acid a,c-diamide synthase